MKVVLNEAEKRLANYLAKARHSANRGDAVANARVGPQDDYTTDLEGIAAEIAFCKTMNVYPDLQTSIREVADCATLEHGTVDVKATKYRSGMLLARTTKKGRGPDCYALMVGEFPEYEFVGWATADELLRDQNLKDLGHGETYALAQSDLRKP